jgi:hypothetical protein
VLAVLFLKFASYFCELNRKNKNSEFYELEMSWVSYCTNMGSEFFKTFCIDKSHASKINSKKVYSEKNHTLPFLSIQPLQVISLFKYTSSASWWKI